MTTFQQVLEKRERTPIRHVVLTPDAFADDWPERPESEIALGLRKVSDNDTQIARAEAAKYAAEMHDDREGQIESFNDFLMRWIVVRGTCDANDITRNAPLFNGFEENVRMALTSKSIRYIWDEIEKFHVETSPLVSPAQDEDLLRLIELLKEPDFRTLSPGAILRIRKLCGFVLGELEEIKRQFE